MEYLLLVSCLMNMVWFCHTQISLKNVKITVKPKYILYCNGYLLLQGLFWVLCSSWPLGGTYSLTLFCIRQEAVELEVDSVWIPHGFLVVQTILVGETFSLLLNRKFTVLFCTLLSICNLWVLLSLTFSGV